jgi:parvulin-like peptidyl-prolyl isomerase
MKQLVFLVVMVLCCVLCRAQKKTVAQLKTDIEKSTNGPLYVKDILKKKFVIDTIVIRRTQHFVGLADSLAYHGKVGKVYGPYNNGKTLVQILAKAPAKFNHVGQIFLDTTLFTKHIADSLANSILLRIKQGTASFEDMAQGYSMGGEAATKGDLGWVAVGYLLPRIEQGLEKCKKGDMFKLWTAAGVHIIKKLDDTKDDNGYVLLMRVFL